MLASKNREGHSGSNAETMSMVPKVGWGTSLWSSGSQGTRELKMLGELCVCDHTRSSGLMACALKLLEVFEKWLEEQRGIWPGGD